MMKNSDVEVFVNCLSPLLIDRDVKSTPYALRLTPQGNYGIEHIEKFFKEIMFTGAYIISRELSKKNVEHFHCIFWTTDYTNSHYGVSVDLEEDEVRRIIRDEFLKVYFPGPAKRGDANKQYNLSVVREIKKSVIYILKDNGQMYFGDKINSEYVEKLRKNSYKKFSKEDFAKELDELKEKFKVEDPDLDVMMVDIIQLKSLYRQPINLHRVYEMCISYQIHNKPSRAVSLVSDYLLSRRI